MLDTLTTDILLISGRTDEAFARLRTRRRSTRRRPRRLGGVGLGLPARPSAPPTALPIIDVMDAQIKRRTADSDDDDNDDDAKRDRA